MLCRALSQITKNDRDYEVLMTGLKINKIVSRSVYFLLDNNLVGKDGKRIGQIRDIADKYAYGKTSYLFNLIGGLPALDLIGFRS